MYIKKGEKVEIFEDPVTRKNREGTATVKSIDLITDDFIFLTVDFCDEHGKVQRQIYIGS